MEFLRHPHRILRIAIAVSAPMLQLLALQLWVWAPERLLQLTALLSGGLLLLATVPFSLRKDMVKPRDEAENLESDRKQLARARLDEANRRLLLLASAFFVLGASVASLRQFLIPDPETGLDLAVGVQASMVAGIGIVATLSLLAALDLGRLYVRIPRFMDEIRDVAARDAARRFDLERLAAAQDALSLLGSSGTAVQFEVVGGATTQISAQHR